MAMSSLSPVWTEVLERSAAATDDLYQDGLTAAWVIPTARRLIDDLSVARTNRSDGQTRLRHTRAFWTGVLAAATRENVSSVSHTDDDVGANEMDAEVFAARAVSGLGVLSVQSRGVSWCGEIGNLAARNCRILGGSMSDIDAAKLSLSACSLIRVPITNCSADIVDFNNARLTGHSGAPMIIDLKIRSPQDGFRARSTLMRFVIASIHTPPGCADFSESDLSAQLHEDSKALIKLARRGKPTTGGAAQFRDCQLEEASFENAALGGVTFEGAKESRTTLRGANFENATLEGATFEHCDLSGARFAGAKFDEASRIGAGCSYSGIDLPKGFPETLFDRPEE